MMPLLIIFSVVVHGAYIFDDNTIHDALDLWVSDQAAAVEAYGNISL